MKRVLFLILGVSIFTSIYSQSTPWHYSIQRLTEGKNLRLGVVVRNFDSGECWSWNGDQRFPMQSVYKFPIALAFLSRCVDGKEMALDQRVTVERSDMAPNLWSPMRDRYPEGGRFRLSEMVDYAMSKSDNNASDWLMRRVGGPSVVMDYLHRWGVDSIEIVDYEKEIQASWAVQYRNWTTPHAMIALLECFDRGKILLSDSHLFLWKTMEGTMTGSVRRLLSPGVTVVHKSGSSGVGREGITAALNDVGVMVLSSGKKFGYAIFISDSRESSQVNEQLLAEVARLIEAL